MVVRAGSLPQDHRGRGLSPALKREIEVLSFAFRSYFPEFFFPSPTGGLLDFASELRRLRTVDPELVRLEFAVPLIDRWPGGGPGRDPEVLSDPAVRRAVYERAVTEADAAVAGALLDDPEALLERFRDAGALPAGGVRGGVAAPNGPGRHENPLRARPLGRRWRRDAVIPAKDGPARRLRWRPRTAHRAATPTASDGAPHPTTPT